MRCWIMFVIALLSATTGQCGMVMSVTGNELGHESGPSVWQPIWVQFSTWEGDQTLNPCWARQNDCALSLFLNSHSIGRMDKEDSWTIDDGKRSSKPANTYITLGEWWRDVADIDKSKPHTDYNRNFWPEVGADYDDACIFIGASTEDGGSTRKYIPGTAVTACQPVVVQAKTCSFNANEVAIKLRAVEGEEADEQDWVSGLSVRCSQRSNVVISTNAGEKIPLGGRTDVNAVLDWGAGYGKPFKLSNLQTNVEVPLRVRVKTVGVKKLTAGVVTGVSIVNLTYQ